MGRGQANIIVQPVLDGQKPPGFPAISQSNNLIDQSGRSCIGRNDWFGLAGRKTLGHSEGSVSANRAFAGRLRQCGPVDLGVVALVDWQLLDEDDLRDALSGLVLLGQFLNGASHF